MRATVVYLIPVAHGRLAVPTTSAVVEAGKVNILFVEMNVPKMQQAVSDSVRTRPNGTTLREMIMFSHAAPRRRSRGRV